MTYERGRYVCLKIFLLAIQASLGEPGAKSGLVLFYHGCEYRFYRVKEDVRKPRKFPEVGPSLVEIWPLTRDRENALAWHAPPAGAVYLSRGRCNYAHVSALEKFAKKIAAKAAGVHL